MRLRRSGDFGLPRYRSDLSGGKGVDSNPASPSSLYEALITQDHHVKFESLVSVVQTGCLEFIDVEGWLLGCLTCGQKLLQIFLIYLQSEWSPANSRIANTLTLLPDCSQYFNHDRPHKVIAIIVWSAIAGRLSRRCGAL